jgi:hypothetical protein
MGVRVSKLPILMLPINCVLFNKEALYAEIAETLSLSQKSVANYAIRIKQKLGAHSLADLIRLAITTGVAKQNVLSLGAGVVT